jgi:multiple sugar transport system substrate-binding protein
LTKLYFAHKIHLCKLVTQLTGITWNHTRGHIPMVATAQRFSELNPGVRIDWKVRSLQEFADFPIQKLVEDFDLLVIDHPFCGYAAAHNTLLPIDEWVPQAFLDNQNANSVGPSHRSYTFGGHQWAFAIDAATPVCGYRPDLLEQGGASVPEDWPELMELARRGLVAVPAIPIDSLMNLYMLCLAGGEEPFSKPGVFIGEDVGQKALRLLGELVDACDPSCLRRNPIATWEALAGDGSAAYCPFAYGYSNYWRPGYADTVLKAGDLVSFDGKERLRSTLGGTGLAISASSTQKATAVEYAQFVASSNCQSRLYFDSGGQPGHRAAWLDPENNRRCNQYFTDTLPTLDSAYLRPRFDGYLQFQDEASLTVHKFLTHQASEAETLRHLNGLAAGHTRAMEGVANR